MSSDKIIKRYAINASDEPTSRYKRLARIVDDEGDEYVESVNPMDVSESTSDYYHTVLSGEEDRLDLISYRYYNTPLLWWVIAEASELFNPLDVPVGTVLRVPSVLSIYGVNGVIGL